ncbi:MAG: hypothetical protein IJY92_00945 [Alphaproteobacteria bacterium]|nr:hypothetical protein [Alphaproteobacteria bacterium]
MTSEKKETKKRYILLTFKPFLQIAESKLKRLTLKKEFPKEEEIEWSLDCSGQGECQPNVSPSDGDEKMDFLNEALDQQKKDTLAKKTRESSS